MGNRRLRAAWLGLLAAPAAFAPLVMAQTSGQSSPLTSIGALSPASGTVQRRAAEAGLAMLAERWSSSKSAPGADRIFDIPDNRTLGRAAIGDGFEMYLVDPTALLSGKRLSQSLYGSGEWRFVVMANGKGVGLITVAPMHGKWTMVQAGASELAGEIASIAARYAVQSPGVRLRFIRSRQALADFIEVVLPAARDSSAPIYVPLISARAMLAPLGTDAIAQAAPLSETQVDAALRPRLQRGMRDPRIGH